MQILRPQAELPQNCSQRAGRQVAAARRHHCKSANEARHYMPTLPAAAIDLGAEPAKRAQKLAACHASDSTALELLHR
jgi:hypothetical protein